MNLTAPQSFKWYQKIALVVTNVMPRVLIQETERVGLSLGFIVVGVLSLMTLEDRNSLFVALYNDFVIFCWSVMLISGGMLTLVGMTRGLRITERAGIALAGLGCLTYGLTLAIYGDGRAKVTGALFLILFLIKVIRLLASTASAAYLAHDETRE